ncbi:DgyrCDS13185 [Dimorphilus gyrociliatus]|uniref:DgyrCDS13185 n=1 Tax=Dimorphilus gyrociliatus TaxID=2664684 RepID=A0A7I8W9X1_9ANNE|nr:DgyrCDS13185 [Dimorphilus gyrociliatus]
MEGLILAARKQYQSEMQQQARFETRIGLHKTSDANPKNIQMGMVAVYTFFRISAPRKKGTRLFVVQGDAGAGKSEFIKNMIYDWAHNKDDKDLKMFDILMALDAARIKPQYDFYDMLRKRAFTKYNTKDVAKLLQNDSNYKLLLAIDGADDARTINLVNLCMEKVNEIPSDITIVVTCRPWIADKFIQQHSGAVIQLELNHFIIQQRRLVFKLNDISDDNISFIESEIEKFKLDENLYTNPLCVFLAAHVWRDKGLLCKTKIELYEETAALLHQFLKLKDLNSQMLLWKQVYKDVKECSTNSADKQKKNSVSSGYPSDSKLFLKIRSIREFLAANYIINTLPPQNVKDTNIPLTEWNHILALTQTLKFCCALSIQAAEILLPIVHSVILQKPEGRVKVNQDTFHPYILHLNIWQGPINVIVDQVQYNVEEECLSALHNTPEDSSPLRQLFPYAVWYVGHTPKVMPIPKFVQVIVLKGQVLDRTLRYTSNLRILNLQEVVDLDQVGSFTRFSQDIMQSRPPIRQIRMVACGLDSNKCQELCSSFPMLQFLTHLDVHENYDMTIGAELLLKSLATGEVPLTYLNMETCGITETICPDISSYLVKLVCNLDKNKKK